MRLSRLATVSFLSQVMCQSLINATSVYPQLSAFRKLLQKYPSLTPPATGPQVTVLVPSDEAFNNYLQTTSNTVESLPLDTLYNIFQYHTLSSVLSSAEFRRSLQVLANTRLTNETYDRLGGRDGQVVLITALTNRISGRNTITIRQSTPQAFDSVLSGQGATVNMDVIDAPWSGGLFQIVDGFLTLPDECIDTMANNPNNLTTFVGALDRSNLSDTLNNFTNVTCLAPVNVAFVSAGSPDKSLSVSDLGQVVKYHVISGAQYSVNLKDGEILTSVEGPKIKIRVDSNGKIWFNDAMVVQPNVITNNGVIHVLDRVLSLPNSTTSTYSSVRSSLTPSSASNTTATAASSSNGATTSSRTATITTSPSNTAATSSSPASTATSGSITLLDLTLPIVPHAVAAFAILYLVF